MQSIDQARYFAIVPAAGAGRRYGGEIPKQYAVLDGRPLIYHSLKVLCENPLLARIFVVLAPDDVWWLQQDWSDFSGRLEVLWCGGKTRAETVLAGLHALQGRVEKADWMLVHDAARPCLSSVCLQRLLKGLKYEGIGGLLAVPVADTLKRSDERRYVVATQSRDFVWQAQTPQLFRYIVLYDALAKLQDEAEAYAAPTDEAGAVEGLGFSPLLIHGDPCNLKVTYAEDLKLAEAILQARKTK